MKSLYFILICFLLVGCSKPSISDELIDMLTIDVDEIESSGAKFLAAGELSIRIGKFKGENLTFRDYGTYGMGGGTLVAFNISERLVHKIFPNKELVIVQASTIIDQDVRKDFIDNGFKFSKNINGIDVYQHNDYSLYIYDGSDAENGNIEYANYQLERKSNTK